MCIEPAKPVASRLVRGLESRHTMQTHVVSGNEYANGQSLHLGGEGGGWVVLHDRVSPTPGTV